MPVPSFYLHSFIRRLPHLQVTRIFTCPNNSIHTTHYTPLSNKDAIKSRRWSVSLSVPLFSITSHFRSPLPARLEAGCAYDFSPKEVLTNLRLIRSPGSGRRALPCSGEQLRRHWLDPSLPQPSLRVGHNRKVHRIFPRRPQGDVIRVPTILFAFVFPIHTAPAPGRAKMAGGGH